MSDLLLALYVLLVAVLSVHGAHRLLLAAIWLRGGSPPPPPPGGHGARAGASLPRVTVQLPVYNERDVVIRAVDALAALRWPADRLQIQVLDDSTDDTGARAESALARARARGLDAVLVRRGTRDGFKAGALANGLTTATGELIAIFDADFVPNPDFLEALVPHFEDPGVGMVQARWAHLNPDEGALTGAQAMMLDGHFVIEHAARSLAGVWTHFNGTAGIWRRTCIEGGGGWQHDTLTEDLDLSYRAQLAGWRFVYRPDVTVPAELPSTLPAFRAQQRRWAKGSVETFRKLAPRILAAPVALRIKAEAMAHLSANFAWPLALVLAAVMPVAVAARPAEHTLGTLALELPAFVLSMLSNVLYYGLATGPRRELGRLPATLLVGIGLAAGQTAAVWEALRGRKSGFERTPKKGASGGSYAADSGGPTALELGLAAWNLGGAIWAGWAGHEGAVPFLLLFAGGFGWVGLAGVRARAAASAAPARVGAPTPAPREAGAGRTARPEPAHWEPAAAEGGVIPGK